MEDTLREKKIGSKIQKTYVLILVLMEDTLRETLPSIKANFDTGLNPCFNGRYSQSRRAGRLQRGKQCLNPCFNGRYSQRTVRTT